MTNENNPAVSIVIAMYNTEKYIGDCLDSVLSQTFQDFEVIVVDDCSTDRSCAIVESYKPKFNGGGLEKLKLLRLEKNHGTAAIPRNKGMDIARGEYLFFPDSDDIVTTNALEDFYTAAKEFDADVVACEKYFELRGEDVRLYSSISREFVDKPTLVTDNLTQRALDINQKNFIHSLCMKLIRKKFLLRENLKMINIAGEDALLNWCMLCAAKRYVLIPSVTYIYRIHAESVSNNPDNVAVEKLIKKWLNSLTQGFKYLDEFLSRKEYFREHPNAKYLMLNALVVEFTWYLLKIYENIPAYQLDALIREEFLRAGDTTALMSFIFARMNFFEVNLSRKDAIIKQLQAQLQQAARP